MSHAELDASTELDRGDIGHLVEGYAQLAKVLDLRVIGGCCGTDHEHVGRAYDALGTLLALGEEMGKRLAALGVKP